MHIEDNYRGIVNKKFTKKTLLNLSFSFFLVIILGATFLSFFQLNKLANIRKWIDHTHHVMELNNDVITEVLSLQAAERGYIITNDPSFIVDFNEKIKKINGNLMELKNLTKDNKEQQKLLEKFESLSIKIINSYKEVIQLQSTNKIQKDFLKDLLHRNKEIVERLDDINTEIYSNEIQLLEEREEQFSQNSDFIIILTSIIYFIDILLLIIILVFFNKLLSTLTISQKKSEDSETLIRNIINGSKDYIGAIDLNYNFIAFNEAYEREFQRIFGKKISLGTNLKTIISHLPEQQKKLLALFERAFNGEQFSVIDKFGSEKSYGNYEITYYPIYNIEGQLVGASVIAREIGKLLQEEIQLKSVNQKLENTLHKVETQAQEMTQINEMNNRLRSSIAIDESLKILALYLKKLIPSSAGIIYLLNHSKNYLEALAEWNLPRNSEKVFSPNNCLGLRQGKLYFFTNSDECIPCKHIEEISEKLPPYLCIPLHAMNEVVGILHIQFPSFIGKNNEEITQLIGNNTVLIQNLSGQVALTISNMKLYELLKMRSTRDVLTNLYNRSYLMETFDRDIQRAKRNITPFAVVMMDFDHFKDINDKYGHEAGDVVLKDIAKLLVSSFRSSDICCRYGGEEILIILYDTPVEDAMLKIEHVRKSIEELTFHFVGTMSITASFGISNFPVDGDNSEALIKAADEALYQAKKEGRNKVIVYKKIDKK